MQQPQMAKLLRGGRLLEYSAHLVPEGGYEMMPEIVDDGILVAGDAAAFCVVTGLNLEGINLAVSSGVFSGQAVIEAHGNKDFSKAGLSSYKTLLEESHVLKDLKLYRRTPKMLHNDRIYSEYPDLVCNMMDQIYRINGKPKKSLTKLFLEKAKEKIGLKNLVSDVYSGWRAL